MQLPISMPGLGHVNTYALVDDRGAAIVDPGLPGPQSWRALNDRLKSAGLKVRDVHTVVITHSHPDHFGGAAQLAKEAGAGVLTHSAFRSWWHAHSDGDGAEEAEVADVHPDDLPPRRAPGDVPPAHRHGMAARGGARGPGAGQWGGRPQLPLRRRLTLRLMRSRMARRFGPPEVTERVKNGDVVKLAGREWTALHTPGHTLDHLCLHDPEAGLLLSGDHVLPTITPHIGGMNAGRDPLGLFFGSLEKVGALAAEVTTVLPAHGHPFDDLSSRVVAIRDHHHERLAKLQEVARANGRPTTVEEFSQHLFRRERWGSMAESETFAHLEYLRLAGDAERFEREGHFVYDLTGASGS